MKKKVVSLIQGNLNKFDCRGPKRPKLISKNKQYRLTDFLSLNTNHICMSGRPQNTA